MVLNEQSRGLRTWLEIDKQRLANNYQVLRRLLKPEVKFLAVVKSNAYGHGLIDYALAVEAMGADYIGVDSVLEGFHVREAGVKAPILVLGHTLVVNALEAAEKNIALTVSNFEGLRAIAESGVKGLKIHLKFDTGMCRQGFFVNEATAVLDEFLKYDNLILDGVYTHFAGSKNPSFPTGTQQQIDQFEEVLAEIKKRGLKPIRHASASSGAIVFPKAHYDMVRFGIALMGLWPSREVEYAYVNKLNLQPILTWKTIVAEVKTVPAGSRVGYDGVELLERETRLAVLPIGYWHGYDRSLSGLGRVIINGHRARVLGRVSMDMIVVDITDAPDVAIGTEVVLLGEQGEVSVTADELADLSASSNYELVTRLNPLIKRLYL